MTVNISNLTITTPVAVSSTNPVALELNGAVAIAEFPSVVKVLSDGSVQFTAPTKGASSKSTHRTRCEWSETQNWTLASAPDHWNRQTMTLTKVNSAQKVVISQMHVRGRQPTGEGVLEQGQHHHRLPDVLQPDQSGEQHPAAGCAARHEIRRDHPRHLCRHGQGDRQVQRCLKSTSELQLDDTWDTHLFEFHGGVYNQVDYTDATPADDGSVCIISDLSLSHG